MAESEAEKARRIARKAAAFELLLNNLPTAMHPDKGDPELVERAQKVLDEQPPQGDGEDD